MRTIKIVKIPPSALAPDHIREAWVGVEIPLVTEEELAANPLSDMRVGSDNVDGYLVFRTKAVEALRSAGKDEAAAFWEDLPIGMYLQFKKDVCEAVA